MRTLQRMRGGSRSVAIANVFAFGTILIICSGGANGNIHDGTDGSQGSQALVLHSRPALQISKYLTPEILTPKVSRRTLCACIEGWSRQA
jgi:hypothetical protein